MITKEDAIAFTKQLEELRKERVVGDEVKVKDLRKLLLDDRGPLDLTRRIDELEEENKTLKARLDKLQKIMFDQFRNKGAL
jgi:hypothetical protein|tara:strand:+ start:1177 stop:1419 length:243 start_codon:yes stop_codon:yes gene_type:complete